MFSYLYCQCYSGYREVVGLLIRKSYLESLSTIKPIDFAKSVFSEEDDIDKDKGSNLILQINQELNQELI